MWTWAPGDCRLPDQAGSYSHLAVASGKSGAMFLMNEDNLGGYSSTMNNVLGRMGSAPAGVARPIL